MPAHPIPIRTWVNCCGIAAFSLMASACSSLRYYAHVAHGQAELVLHRRSLDAVIAAPDSDAKLVARLRLARDARRFASQQLRLPDNRSYTSFVDLQRPYVVWNVFAAKTTSVDPVLHCFPIAGCVPYRGYFDESLAKSEAARLGAEGNDVFVGGVAAYSTLGWFADPILSSMLRWDDDELASTIFHELAHQLIYVKDDTVFNESFASFVQREGLREWRAALGQPATAEHEQIFDEDFARLVLDLRERLRQLYASKIAPGAMAMAKTRMFDDFRGRYARWRDAQPADAQGHVDHSHDAFVAGQLNNASLLPFGIYDQWTPAFQVLFDQGGGAWPVFYQRVRDLAKLTPAARSAALAQWQPKTRVETR